MSESISDTSHSLCSRVLSYVAKFLRHRQARSNIVTQTQEPLNFGGHWLRRGNQARSDGMDLFLGNQKSHCHKGLPEICRHKASHSQKWSCIDGNFQEPMTGIEDPSAADGAGQIGDGWCGAEAA